MASTVKVIASQNFKDWESQVNVLLGQNYQLISTHAIGLMLVGVLISS